MSVQTRTSVRIRVPWRTVFDLASAVDRWPEILPHYRWVRVLARDPEGSMVEMAARRGLWPVRWVARMEPRLQERRVYFRHLRGPTRGMKVYWELDEREGDTSVTIVHELSLANPLLRAAPGRWIVASGFIEPIASRTLACMKRIAESAAAREVS